MTLNINTNMASLNAQKNLSRTQNALDKSMARLSSGLRINSAKDDAAGMAISNRFVSQIRGLNQAIRNANDGISMLQTSEGGMQEVTNILQRMRELAVQAANDTNSNSDRASLQAEMDQLYAEIDRISGATQFNGMNLLDGSVTTRSFQVGANYGQNVTVSLKSVSTKDLNLNGYSKLGELNSGRVGDLASSGATNLTINGYAITDADGLATASTAALGALVINSHTLETGVTANAYNTYRGAGGTSGIVSGLTINDVEVGPSGNMSELVANINRDAPGVTATLNSDQSITLSNDTGENIKISGATLNSGLISNSYQGYISLQSNDGSAIEIGDTSTIPGAGVNKWGFNISTSHPAQITGGAVTTSALAAGDLKINGVEIGASSSASAGDKAVAINELKDETGVLAKALTRVEYTVNMNVVTDATFSASNFNINGSAIDLTTANTLGDVINKINSKNLGIVASADASTGNLVLTSESGQDINVYLSGIASVGGMIGTAATATRGSITLTSDTGVDINISGLPANLAKAGFTEQGGSPEAIGSGLSLMSLENANNALERIDDAINMISDNRAELGAVQNRLDSTISNLQNVSENLSAANSRIMDADFAKETADMSKQQIMMQAGVAMLAQAKQLPQNVLQLLQQ